MVRSIVTQRDVERGLAEIGVRPGDVVFFHSSLSGFGYVVGGADAVIDAFLAAVGPTGTVCVPTFNLEDRAGEFGAWWDVRTTRSTVGTITDVFWRRPAARRSNHPIHSVAAIGPLADRITRVHRDGGERPSPWNGSFNIGAPFDHLYDLNARYMLVGISFMPQTMCHYIEQLLVEECLHRAAAHDLALAASLRASVSQLFRAGGVWPGFDRIRIGERLLSMGFWRRVQIGDALLFMADTQPYVATIGQILRDEPRAWLGRDFLEWYARVPGVALPPAPEAPPDPRHDPPAPPPAPPPEGMARVPAGPFIRGSVGTDREARPDELPQRLIDLDEFYIDRHPVTNLQYWRFVRATDHRAPPHWRDGAPPAGRDDLPVFYVDWHDAAAYAAWAGKRLPTEAEWEKAARGGLLLDGASERNPIPWRRYPWGDAFDPEHCQASTSPSWGVAPVGAHSPGGDSPYGVADLVGNVLEWVADWYDPVYYRDAPERNPTGPRAGTLRVLRGGAFSLHPSHARCAYRCALDPTRAFHNNGIRCAWTPDRPAARL